MRHHSKNCINHTGIEYNKLDLSYGNQNLTICDEKFAHVFKHFLRIDDYAVL
jgi:hypothetical protein